MFWVTLAGILLGAFVFYRGMKYKISYAIAIGVALVMVGLLAAVCFL